MFFSNRNLSGMSSEESLNSRLRPGVTGQQRTQDAGPSHLNFQEELKRLIDPDISESDLATLSVSIFGIFCSLSSLYLSSDYSFMPHSS